MNFFGTHHLGQPQNASAGDTFLSTTDGYLYAFDGSTWIKSQLMMPVDDLGEMVKRLGKARVMDLAQELERVENAAASHETIRVLLDRLRVAMKLISVDEGTN